MTDEPEKKTPVRVAIAGAGDRGRVYASYLLEHPDEGTLVAVADPNEVRRKRLGREHRIPQSGLFTDWRELARPSRVADAVIVATQDRMHTEPALVFAERGYAMLLEKPLAPTEPECRRIVDSVKVAGIIFAVGHVLRYTPYWRRVKTLIDEGRIGEVVAIQHLEPVGFWHHAHSFVRGAWRNSHEASPMVLAKSCHDLDILGFLAGAPWTAVSSFGALKHFRAEEKPPDAGSRCIDCAREPQCPYSAKRIYLTAGTTDWPVSTVSDTVTPEALEHALAHGPYGRCVYSCDNDVVDHQIINLLYANGVTASFTLCAFTRFGGRRTRIMGTKGELSGDSRTVRCYDFLSDRTTTYDTFVGGGHGGGDEGIMQAFLAAVRSGDPASLGSTPDEVLESHLAAFAAERARLENTVVGRCPKP